MSRRALLAQIRASLRRTGDAIAADDGETRIGGTALDRSAEAVARALAEAGVRPGVPVALFSGHRVEAIVGMLGVVRAGACLVPLNVHESADLLARVWRDAGSPLVLADRRHAPAARAIADAAGRVLVLDDLVAVGAAPPRLAVAAPVEVEAWDDASPIDVVADDVDGDADDLLAILYTSGTTAEPKGVMTTAASVLERARQYVEASGLAPGERQAAITSWHFAASIPEIYGALVAGAELRLYDAHARGVEALPGWARAERIGLLQLPVAMARRLLAGAASASGTAAGATSASGASPARAAASTGAGPDSRWLGSVRFASISGDRLRREEAERLLRAMAPGATLLHTYGSTETNLIAQCALRLPASDWPAASEGGFLPVGRPVAGKTVHVVDERGEPVAPGDVGRIAVAGARLSPGYWNRPDRTAESFRVGPGGARVYVSGDFGRLREDGRLELRGRDSALVKVRGMRVDLAAVEAVLLALEGVAGAAVVARATDAGETRLVGHVEAAPGVALDTTVLRARLAGRLPAHAIPARFVFLDALPTRASGKLDRRRLPDPGRERPRQAAPYSPPRDADEALVCARWAARFDLDCVGADDGFFDLGGDSLALVEMLAELERETGEPLALARLGGVPTPARLAVALKAARRGAAGTAASAPGMVGAAEDATVARRPERRLRVLRRAVKQAIRHPLRAGGPVVWGHPLPRASGDRLHAQVARGLFASGLVRDALRPVEAWHARLGLESPCEAACLRSIRANTWLDWRLRALEREADFARGVVIEGMAALDGVADQGRGLVFIVTHVGWNALLRRIPALEKRDFRLIRQPKDGPFGSGPDAIATGRAEQLRSAIRLLERGGVVLIAGDEGHGQAAVERAFFGGLRRFRPGAAALAEATGAALVPVFSWLRDDGVVVFRFEPPLDSEAETADARTLERTARYAERYTAWWPRIFDSVSWKSVRRALDPPGHW